jgi:type III pantothenate kinase
MSALPPTPLLVVDVGNTRVKWGRCDANAVAAAAALPPDDPAAWQRQLDAWALTGPLTWAVGGVHPARRDRLAEWLRQRGDTVHLLTSPEQLPLRTALPHPEKAGIDRLLNAVAVNSRRRPGTPAVVIDAGSAVTVDFIDEQGGFQGGAILPGLRLMAQALHDYTALLPVVTVDVDAPVPAANTVDALKSGILAAALGGIEWLLARAPGAQVFVGGGDAELVAPRLTRPAEVWPLMTLEGVRLSVASAFPAPTGPGDGP